MSTLNGLHGRPREGSLPENSAEDGFSCLLACTTRQPPCNCRRICEDLVISGTVQLHLCADLLNEMEQT